MSNHISTIFLCSALIIVSFKNHDVKKQLISQEERLTRLEFRVDKLCAGKC